jgi:hypothetical protein
LFILKLSSDILQQPVTQLLTPLNNHGLGMWPTGSHMGVDNSVDRAHIACPFIDKLDDFMWPIVWGGGVG